MRLAFVLYKYFPYGGMQRDFKRFVEEVQTLGHEVRIYYNSWQGEPLPGTEMRNVPVKALSNHRRNVLFSAWLAQDLQRNPVDAVVGFNKMPGLDVYYAADSCYLDKALNERSWWYRQGARFRHFAQYEEAVFGPASATEILLISRTEQDKFVEHYHTDPSRLHMLPPGISADRRAPSDAEQRRELAREKLGLAQWDHVLLFVGSGFIKKGLDRAIQALAEVKKTQPEKRLRLLVVGQDRETRFRRLAARLDVAEEVQFLGGRDDIPEILLAADVLIHPAKDEAAGIVLLEALVAGLPVLVTDVCGYAHHIATAEAGIVLSSPFQPSELNAAVTRTLQPEVLRDFRNNALRYADEEDLYSMHTTGAALIERLVKAKNSSP